MGACFWLTLNYYNKNHVRNKSEVDAYGWIMPPVSVLRVNFAHLYDLWVHYILLRRYHSVRDCDRLR